MPVAFTLVPDVRDLGYQPLIEFGGLLDQRQRLFLPTLQHCADQRRHRHIVAAKQTTGNVGRLAARRFVFSTDTLYLADDTLRETLPWQQGAVQRSNPILAQSVLDYSHDWAMELLLNDFFSKQLVSDEPGQALLRRGHLISLVFGLQRLGQFHRARREPRHALHDFQSLFLLTADYGTGELLCYLLETLLQQARHQPPWVASKHNVHTPARHVGGNGHHARTTCLGNDHRLLLVAFAVEHLVGNVPPLEHIRKPL